MAITNLIQFNNLRGDIFGGVTAAVVSLPPAVHSALPLGWVPAVDSMGQFVAAFLPLCLAVPQRRLNRPGQ